MRIIDVELCGMDNEIDFHKHYNTCIFYTENRVRLNFKQY